ncbi:MAG TPA: carotenoid biosynthesis protein [Methylomirabilota bacterium]|nr:carotenoid biosynthesis protein [Methylomirabilota bacterium]
MDLLVGTLILRPYVFAFLAAFLWAGARDLGWRRTLTFTAWVWPVAWVAEFASTRVGVPFGLYHYTGATRGQELFIANVPLMDSLSFTFLAYAAFCLARGALGGRAGAWPLTLVGGVAMMLLDVVIDPIAVRGDQWFLGLIFYYPDGGAYFGVPLSNFAGWAVVGMAAVGGFLVLTRNAPGARPEPGIALYYAVLAFNLAVTAWIREWVLLGLGVLVHAVAAAVLYAVHRRPAARPGMESQKA